MTVKNIEVTPEELKAIKRLQNAAKNFPKTLWLFSASGTLCVMKKENGSPVMLHNTGGVDPDYIIDTIKIENDGGDW
jgi:hypothetical protein